MLSTHLFNRRRRSSWKECLIFYDHLSSHIFVLSSLEIETGNNKSVNFEEKNLFTCLFLSFHSCLSFGLLGTLSADANETSVSTSHTHSGKNTEFLFFVGDLASLVDRFRLDDWKHWTLQLSCNGEFRFLKKKRGKICVKISYWNMS